MKLFHGSNNRTIETLIPLQADHDRPYIYLSENQVVASFYTINCVDRPYYWFPYGFTRDHTPYYEELYPQALQKACKGKHGVVYEVEVDLQDLVPFKNIPGAWLSTVPLTVQNRMEIADPYEWFLQCEREGKMFIHRYENKTAEDLARDDRITINYLLEKHMIATPECSYTLFIKKKFPWVWEQYCIEEQQKLKID